MWGRIMASRALRCGWCKNETFGDGCRDIGGCKKTLLSCRAISRHLSELKDPKAPRFVRASTVTPGQAGLPAEFKHINKRRKRNLQGFP